MKAGIAFVLCLVATMDCAGQVMFRNDITLGKHRKRSPVSFITINVGRRYSPDMYTAPRSGNTLIIDVDALRHPEKTYTYRQLAERVYGVDPIPFPNSPRVPEFLLAEPPPISQSAMMVRVRRSQSYLER